MLDRRSYSEACRARSRRTPFEVTHSQFARGGMRAHLSDRSNTGNQSTHGGQILPQAYVPAHQDAVLEWEFSEAM